MKDIQVYLALPEVYFIGSTEGYEYLDLQVEDEVNPRLVFIFS
jgi:hypothetical protein